MDRVRSPVTNLSPHRMVARLREAYGVFGERERVRVRPVRRRRAGRNWRSPRPGAQNPISSAATATMTAIVMVDACIACRNTGSASPWSGPIVTAEPERGDRACEEHMKGPVSGAGSGGRGPAGMDQELPVGSPSVYDQGFGRSGDLGHTVQVALRQVHPWPGIRPAPTHGRVRSPPWSATISAAYKAACG